MTSTVTVLPDSGVIRTPHSEAVLGYFVSVTDDTKPDFPLHEVRRIDRYDPGIVAHEP